MLILFSIVVMVVLGCVNNGGGDGGDGCGGGNGGGGDGNGGGGGGDGGGDGIRHKISFLNFLRLYCFI